MAIVIAILKQVPVINIAITLIVAFIGMGLLFSGLRIKNENKEVAAATKE